MDSLFWDLRGEWVATAALTTLILLVRQLFASFVRRSEIDPDARRRWLVQVRTGAVLTLVFGLTVIWAQELRTVALSLAAVAVAVTIAVKELLLCLAGALVRTSSSSFSIGDRIQIAGIRGDVIDLGAMTTKILEVDEATNRRTGRGVTLPNSMFLDLPVVNETFASSYVLSIITVPLGEGSEWSTEERALLDAAHETCASFLEDAKTRLKRSSTLEVLEAPLVDPTVSLLLREPGEITLQLRFPAPVRRAHRIAQTILRRYLELRPSKPKDPARNEEEWDGRGI